MSNARFDAVLIVAGYVGLSLSGCGSGSPTSTTTPWVPTLPPHTGNTTTPMSGIQCHFQTGSECVGESLAFSGRPSASPQECCDQCSLNELCAAWTFLHGEGSGWGRCELKTACSQRPSFMHTSGFSGHTATCEVKNKTDCVGRDMGGGGVHAKTPEDCCDVCSATPGCTAFTHRWPDFHNKPWCYLKTGCSTRVENENATSGTNGLPFDSQCPGMVEDVECDGVDILDKAAATPDECCDFCTVTNGCAAFTHKGIDEEHGEPWCYLKASCESQPWLNNTNATSGTYGDAAQCIPFPGIDCGEDDIADKPASSYGECCDACAALAGCGGFTFKNPDYYHGQPWCYMKASCLASNQTEDPPCTSGATPNVAKCGWVRPGKDCAGNELVSRAAATPEECCDLCTNTHRCQAFTHRADDPAHGQPYCYLKTACDALEDCESCNSGTPGIDLGLGDLNALGLGGDFEWTSI